MKAGKYLSIQDMIDIVRKRKIYKVRKGTPYFSAYPTIDKNRQPTPKQLIAQARFKRCTEYAQNVIKDPVIKQAYEVMAKDNQTAFNRAFSDASQPPVVLSIMTDGYLGCVGNSIFVNAVDDFLVKRVVLSVYKNKKLMEEGDAVELTKNIWEYNSKALVPDLKNVIIIATAYDMPGNFHSKEVKL